MCLRPGVTGVSEPTRRRRVVRIFSPVAMEMY